MKAKTRQATLPLFQGPAHERQTLIAVFKNARKINTTFLGQERKTVITLNMALYEKARRLELLHPEFKRQVLILNLGVPYSTVCSSCDWNISEEYWHS